MAGVATARCALWRAEPVCQGSFTRVVAAKAAEQAPFGWGGAAATNIAL